MTDSEEILSLIKRHTAQIREHVDSVQIIVTTKAEGQKGTLSVSWGDGDWYARYGAAREFCVICEQCMLSGKERAEGE